METVAPQENSEVLPSETSFSEPQNPSNSESQRDSASFDSKESKPSSKKKEVKPKTPLKDQSQNEVIQRLSASKSPVGLISPKEIIESMRSACKSSLSKKAKNEEENEDKENRPEPAENLPGPVQDSKSPFKIEQPPKESIQKSAKVLPPIEELTQAEAIANDPKPDQQAQTDSKTPNKPEERKPAQEASTNAKSAKSIGKVALFYHKCGRCGKAMTVGKEKTRLLSCTHRFHEECINGKGRCFLCDGLEAYDSRPSERSLKNIENI